VKIDLVSSAAMKASTANNRATLKEWLVRLQDTAVDTPNTTCPTTTTTTTETESPLPVSWPEYKPVVACTKPVPAAGKVKASWRPAIERRGGGGGALQAAEERDRVEEQAMLALTAMARPSDPIGWKRHSTSLRDHQIAIDSKMKAWASHHRSRDFLQQGPLEAGRVMR